MKLYEDSIDQDDHFSIIEKVNDQGLWRLVAQKDAIKIYDNKEVLAANWRNKMRLVTPSSNIKLFSWGAFMMHFGDTQLLLTKFINEHYHLHLHKGDFRDKQEIVNYLLDKESTIVTKLDTPSSPQTDPHK